MRVRIVAVAVALASVAGCAGGNGGAEPVPVAGPTTTAAPPTSTPTTVIVTAPADPTAAVMAAALTHLVTYDHTFGSEDPPFEEYLVQADLDPGAGASAEQAEFEGRALTGAERAAVEDAVGDLAPVRWIDDRDAAARRIDEEPMDALLGVGVVTIDGDEALAPVSLLCGSMCGYWVTYRLVLRDGAWEIVGDTGEITVA